MPRKPNEQILGKASNHVLRYKNGDWCYADQPEGSIKAELADTDLREIQSNLNEIQQERSSKEPPKWSLQFTSSLLTSIIVFIIKFAN